MEETKEKIGLVLSGGAGRGAFEIGVLNALEENGILESVTGISGTSVGALNMALCRRKTGKSGKIFPGRICVTLRKQKKWETFWLR